MKIYHGSTEIIEHPLILDIQRFLDFGKGFYTTTSRKQAEKWALIKQKRLGIPAKPYVTVYEIEDNLLEDNSLKVKRFNQADEDWLDFVVRNRRENFNHPYDIVMGAVANDTLYRTLTLFETGILTKLETISRLRAHILFDQISFHNQEILDKIKYVGSHEVKGPKKR
jgi:hypothetical protein